MKNPHLNWTYISLFLLIIISFPKFMSAQTVEISPNLRNEKILFGTEITATEVENAEEYMFLIYSQDSSFSKTITKSVNYLTHLDYQGLPRFYFLNYRVKALVNNVWTEYSQATRINIILDCAFDEMYMERVFTQEQVALIDNQVNEIKLAAMQKELSTLEEITIPIVFHVMVPSNQSEFDFLTPSKISQAVEILNQLYAGEFSNNEIDTKIRFCLAPEYYDGVEEISLSVPYAGQTYNGITYHNHDGTGINLPNNSDLPYISNSENVNSPENLNAYYSVFPTDDFLNIFIFDQLHDSSIYGFAWSAAHPIGPNIYGYVAIDKDVVGINDIPNRELGFTLGHEIGHYFGLWHTWTVGAATESECTEDDEIDDTAPHRFPNFTCNENSDQCPDDNLNDPIHNVMNYTPDGCRNQFTELQASYMRSVIDDTYSTLNNPLPYDEAEDISHCVTVPDIEDIAIIAPGTGGFCSGSNNITIFPDDAESFVLHIYENNQLVSNLSDANFNSNWETTYNFNENSHYTLVLDATMGDATHTVEQEYDVFECGETDYTDAQWHFDHGVSLDFTSGYAQLGDTEIEAEKCETSACDDSGNLLFYTNGHDIWDHNHVITNISINDAAGKGKGIIPLKLEETENYAIYSLIYLNNTNTLSYLTITIDKSNYSITENDSDELISSTDFTGLGISNPEMVSLTAVEKIAPNEYQVISCIKDNLETNYRPIAIDIPGSIPTSFDSNNCNISPIDINMGLSDATSAYDQTVKASPDAKFIVYSNPGSETFLFNFNTETGEFIELTSCISQGVKNSVTAFSPNSQFLYYYIITNQKHTIFQVNLEDINLCEGCDLFSIPIYERDIDESNYLLSTYFLQEGPDGKIYFSRHSEFDANAKYIGVISQPNNNAASIYGPNPCGVIDDYIHYTAGSGLINKFYLPNFVDGKADPCDLDFKLCSDNCGGDVQILNLSHGLPGEFTWVVNNGTNTIPTDGTSFTVSGDSVYTVTLSKVGCDPESDSITINSAPASTSISGAEEICLGNSSNYFLDFSTSENATWYVDGVAQSEGSSVFTLNTDGYSVGSVINLSVDAINNSGCDVYGEMQVTVTGFSHQIITSDYCSETSPGQIDVQVGDETYLPLDFIFEDNSYELTETTGNYFDLLPGVYSYTISDGTSCSNTEEFEIQNSPIVNHSITRIGCRAYKVDFQPEIPGNYTYQTYIDGNLVTLNDPFTISPAEEYDIVYPIHEYPFSCIVSAIDNTNGCVSEFPLEIQEVQNYEILETNIQPAFCSEHLGSIELIMNGNYTITCDPFPQDASYTQTPTSNGDFDIGLAWQETFSDLPAGEYTIVITNDEYGYACIDSVHFTIEQADIANVTPTITPGCFSTNSGSVVLTIDFAETLMPSGQVEWSNGMNTDYTLLTGNTYETSLNNLGEGTYDYTITSDIGCDLVQSVYISEPSAPTVYAGQDTTICGEFKGNIGNAATGGNPPYTYNWSPVDFITPPSTPADYNPYIVLSSLGSNIFTVTVTDINGCTTSDDITITILESPNVSLSATDELICLGESTEISAEITGGVDPLEIDWSHDSGLHSNTAIVSPTEWTDYTIFVTGANGCIQNETINIDVENISIYSDVNYQYGNNYASVDFSFYPDISTTNYSFTLVDENNNPYTNFNALPTGHTYTATLVSENGCTYTDVFDLIFIDSYSTSIIELNPITCIPEPNGSITIQIEGGLAPYEVNIYNPENINISSLTVNEQGTYTFDLTDLQPTGEDEFTVQISDANGNSQGLSTSISYAWNSNGITLTSGNIGAQELFTDRTIQLGNLNDQNFNILHDITFKNCIIYTNTWGADEEETVWTVNKPYDLILDNTTVQSGCPDNMWQGIEAQGQHGEHTTDVQSLVMLKNGSSISDAICAIKSINGAIIQTENSFYLNNQYDLYFTHYCSNQSATKINNNVFETTRYLNKEGVYPKSHVFMTWVKGLKFKNNQFRNSMPFNSKEYQYVNQRGIGISSNFSSYDVSPVLGVNYTMAAFSNEFEGLFYGVRARSSYGTPVRVHHSTFTNNFRGIYMRDNNSARVMFNTFNTTTATPLFQWIGYSLNGTPDDDESYAVYLSACENFFLEENSAKNGDAGFYVYNTGSTAGKFYKNNIGAAPESGETYNMKAGAIAVGSNSDYEQSIPNSGQVGLEIRCNTFDATGKAIGVVNGNIRRNQGTSSGDNKDLAGNQFSETLVNGMDFTAQIQENHFHDFSHFNLGIYNYYQHDDNNSESEQNGYDRILRTNFISGVIGWTQLGKPFVETDACPSHYSRPFIDSDQVVDALSAIRHDRADYNNLLEEYRQIIDKGNTEYLKATAELMNDENYATAFEILKNEGYLTDTVLTAILCNNIAPESALVAILIENSPLPKEVIELVDRVELDANLKKLLMIYQDGVNNRVKLEYAMSDVLQRIADNESKIINIAHNNDSLVSVSDSVLQYLKPLALNDYKYSMQKYKLLVSKQNFRTAKLELAHLNDLAKNRNDSIGKELETFITVENIQLAYLDKMDTTIIAKNKTYLEEMAMMESDMYSGKAQNLLALIGEYPYFEYTPMPEDISNPRRTEKQADIKDMFKPTLNIYPNPTKGILTIEYNFEIMQKEGMDLLMQVLGYTVKEHCKHGEVNIYTTAGRLLQTIPLNKLRGNKTIDLSTYPSGNYIVELKDCYENNNSIMITKQ